MKILINIGFLFCLILVNAGTVAAQFGLVCGNPKDKGCRPQYDDFKAYDLGFLTGRAELGTGNRHESNEFYAVILTSVKAPASNRLNCNFISEAKRLAAQKLFPANKVFASRNSCVGTIVVYDGVDNDYNFLAVFGGQTESEAEKILAKAKKKYPSANLRKMKVVLDFADQ